MSRKQKDAAVAQSVVRRIGSAEVTSSILVSSFTELRNRNHSYSRVVFFIQNPRSGLF